MRIILSTILFLAVECSLFAVDADIKTVMLHGSPSYFLYIANLNSERQAEDIKKKLTKQQKSFPLQIQVNDKHYTVKIGPIAHYDDAKTLKNQFADQLPSPPTFFASSIPSNEEAVEKIKKAKAVAPLHQDEKKLWNLANADIRAVIAEVSRITGKNFIIDPRVQGKISIVSTTPLSNSALYQVFLSILQVSGYSAVQNSGTIRIIPNMDAKSSAPDILAQMRRPPRGGEIMTSVVPVHYVPADQLVPVLRPLMPQWSFVSAYAPANMLILSGTADNIKQLTNIIKQVDSSSANDIDVIQIHNALAMDIAATLKDLLKPGTGGAPINTGQAVPTLAIDDRNNTILVSGTRTDRLKLRVIISKLDHPPSSSTSNHTQVIYLHYLRAEDLVPILAGVAQANFSGNVGTTIGTITRPALDSTNPVSSIVGDNPYSSIQNPQNSPQQQQPPAPTTSPSKDAAPNTSSTSTQEGNTKPTIQIIAEPNTNSIIINGPATIIRIIQTVIHKLDIRPAQLLVEAIIASINESSLTNLGIEWGTLGQTGENSSFQPGFAILSSKTSISDFQARLYALQLDNKLNVISTPSVVVLDNRQAKILVGKQVSVASTSYPNNANGTTVSSSPYTTFNRMNVALHLYVRPQITKGQDIQLQIDEGLDTIDPTSAFSTTPDTPTFDISSIVTAVHVHSGDIVILGGLAEDTLANNNDSIPILKDIPGFGRLFQKNVRDREKRIIMVFIRPIILKSRLDNLYITGEKYAPTRNEERRIVRSQELFAQEDIKTILKPLHSAKLPTPFVNPKLDEK
ncbi:MAG: type II protein secretion LspD [Legionellales bacterium RIFCSPHIGHO2_12_FULL_37_14]|nr:MAG: type II protein secretion LspD [Legionellales bacterium RIFCSPHIGHO2_12_FULL_37_14]